MAVKRAASIGVRDVIADIVRVAEDAYYRRPNIGESMEVLAARLDGLGEPVVAKRLRAAIKKTGTTPSQLRPLPVDSDSRIETLYLESHADIPLFLRDEEWLHVHQFLRLYSARDRLVSAGLDSCLSMLLCGPPGVGKSQVAKYVAAQIGLPLLMTRFDSLFNSHLGNTSKNIGGIFEAAKGRPSVLFLDELDAIGNARVVTEGAAGTETNRIVITLMQNIERMPTGSILLAATNRKDVIDAAIWRRFARKMSIDLPTVELREKMLTHFFGTWDSSGELSRSLSGQTEGMSGSQLKDIGLDLIREAVINDCASVTMSEALLRVEQEKRVRQLAT